jgi:hypothetical protein
MPRKSKMRRRNIGYTETAEALTLTMPQIDLLRKVAPKRSLMAKVVEETMRTGGAMLEPRELNRLDNEVEDVETGYMSDGEIRSLIAIKKQIMEAEERADFAEIGYLPSGEPRPIYGKRKNKGATMPIIFKNPSSRRHNAVRLNPRRRRNAMLEMDFEEEINDLPILANPRKNGMVRRRNGIKRRRNMSENVEMRDLRAKFRAEYGDKWAEDEDVYLDYLVEKKQARGSKQSAAEIKRIAIEKRVSERNRFTK